jgi:hypothetical protein
MCLFAVSPAVKEVVRFLLEILWRHVSNVAQVALATLPTRSIAFFAL